MSGTPRGRYAPSPTGELHLGNASSALLAWLSVRSRGGTWVMRIEDLDPGRSRPEYTEQLLQDLRWFGLDWDEGPDVGGPHEPYLQSERGADYLRAFHELQAARRVYPCFCSRKDIAAAASAPQQPGDEIHYPGTCRDLSPAEASERIADGRRHAWRFRMDPDVRADFVDAVRGPVRDPGGRGDFVVRRADGGAAYHLAVVVDDHRMEIDDVVRGDDLLVATPRQIHLCRALGLRVPSYAHVPLLIGPDGARLSKRHAGITLRELRESGHSAEGLVGRLALLLGLRSSDAPAAPADLVGDYHASRLVSPPGGIDVDPAVWPVV